METPKKRTFSPEQLAHRAAYQRAFRAKNPGKRYGDPKDSKLRHLYGITLLDKRRLYDLQLGKCAICSEPFDFAKAQVDHCHITKKVRSLLCTHCNKGLGCFRDRPDLLEKGAEYVKSFA